MAFMIPIVEGLGQLKWTWFMGPRARPLIDFQIIDRAANGVGGCVSVLFRMKGYEKSCTLTTMR